MIKKPKLKKKYNYSILAGHRQLELHFTMQNQVTLTLNSYFYFV